MSIRGGRRNLEGHEAETHLDLAIMRAPPNIVLRHVAILVYGPRGRKNEAGGGGRTRSLTSTVVIVLVTTSIMP